LNLRAETSPENLRCAVEHSLRDYAIKNPALQLKTEHLESFRPGKPQPTHRFQKI
jgi:hypothetical protein